MRRRLLITSLAAGFISITAQSLIIRELVVAFLGNELVIGFTLGAWLFWTGVGSATLGRLAERSGRPANWLAAELIALAVFLPTCFVATLRVRSFAGLEAGEAAGPIPIVVACLTVLCPLCILNGSIFPTLCRALSGQPARSSTIARVYVWEAIGSVVGGVLVPGNFMVHPAGWTRAMAGDLILGWGLALVVMAAIVRTPKKRAGRYARS